MNRSQNTFTFNMGPKIAFSVCEVIEVSCTIELHLSVKMSVSHDKHCCADWEFRSSSVGHHGSPLLMMTTSGLKSLSESAEEEQINQDIRCVTCFCRACSNTPHALMQASVTVNGCSEMQYTVPCMPWCINIVNMPNTACPMQITMYISHGNLLPWMLLFCTDAVWTFQGNRM